MTEKRFTIVNMGLDGQYIKENGKIMTIERVVDLLNENEQLKEFAQHNYSESKKTISNLQKENEQLKQQIQQLQHWNKCLAEKRHQELSYRPYTASKSEKELKELLEPKLFNCSDR